jgi:hypothetical protein
MPRALRALLVFAALVSGCDPLVYDHTPGQCVRADDGTPCDDRNVCTTSTVCRAGVCGGTNPVDTCTVADSDRDFAGTQGADGWYYGYWNASGDPDGSYDSSADFVEMEYCPDESWSPPGRWMPRGRCSMDRSAPGYRWTMILVITAHPETRPDTELPIRRWVSDVSGPARMLVDNFVGGEGGDGSRAMLFVDGVERWRNDAPVGEDARVRAAIDTELEIGTVIEQSIHPLEDPNFDMTHFTLSIESR